MNKELSDRAWACLPREFRKEVKKEWRCIDNADRLPHDAFLRGKYQQMRDLFGHHNLTSDAEGEDNLQERLWNMLSHRLQTYCRNMGRTSHDGNVEDVLEHLFGSKCLPDTNEDNFATKEPKYRVNDKVICGVLADRKECIIVHYNINTKEYRLRVLEDGTTIHRSEEFIYGFAPNEPKPAEPKFKRGDKVRILSLHGRTTPDKGKVDVIAHINPDNKEQMYYLENHYHCAFGFSESDLEPYTAPPENYVHIDCDLDTSASTFTDDCQSQCKSQDHIPDPAKMVIQPETTGPTFVMSPRLQIAAMAMQGTLSNAERMKQYGEIAMRESASLTELVAANALRYADALLSECEKGGNQ